GLLTSHEGQPYYRVLVHSDQATGLANATTLLQMLQDRKGLVLGKFGAVQGGALAFREALLAGATGQDTTILVGAIAKADAEVVEAAATVVGAARVLATEDFQVVHRGFQPLRGKRKSGQADGISVESS